MVADVNVEGRAGLFAGGDQVVECPFVGENPPRERMEVLGPTIGAAPAQELGQVQQLVLEDPLQRLEPVAADQATDRDRALDVLKRVEQQSRRDRDLVVDLRSLGLPVRWTRRTCRMVWPAALTSRRDKRKAIGCASSSRTISASRPRKNSRSYQAKSRSRSSVPINVKLPVADLGRLGERRLVDPREPVRDLFGRVEQGEQLGLALDVRAGSVGESRVVVHQPFDPADFQDRAGPGDGPGGPCPTSRLDRIMESLRCPSSLTRRTTLAVHLPFIGSMVGHRAGCFGVPA